MRLSNGEVLLRWPLAQHIITVGWKDARGCRVEHLAASEYDLKIIHGKG